MSKTGESYQLAVHSTLIANDQPEPPDMHNETVTLRQKIESKIEEPRHYRNNDMRWDHGPYITGAIDMLRDVLDWMDSPDTTL